MSDRTLVTYEEERNEHGPYWRLEIQRSASGQPGLLFTITFDSFEGNLPHQEMTIVVKDGYELLAPVLDWLDDGEQFCDQCLAGIKSSEHYEKCEANA